jgi:hypothetical protein
MLAQTEEKKETDNATVASGMEEGIWGHIGTVRQQGASELV